ncbi:unnamed protein product [Didymodactylos carnosus]|uniref:Uncharacterized protein n=1 Tax=Didymodactylos carnosus TaxID=1234261 RepID=A0A814GU33_9BILA|nr:unnamed protein product [Didymodactylos carnosus]CAF3772550.1 unnamed protein product [Didymodactylos carnosus]
MGNTRRRNQLLATSRTQIPKFKDGDIVLATHPDGVAQHSTIIMYHEVVCFVRRCEDGFVNVLATTHVYPLTQEEGTCCRILLEDLYENTRTKTAVVSAISTRTHRYAFHRQQQDDADKYCASKESHCVKDLTKDASSTTSLFSISPSEIPWPPGSET